MKSYTMNKYWSWIKLLPALFIFACSGSKDSKLNQNTRLETTDSSQIFSGEVFSDTARSMKPDPDSSKWQKYQDKPKDTFEAPRHDGTMRD